ncbi:MAG: flippase-like domain-containing protein [Anaerolineales bacterium]|nr:flippase-like domain-containing protein [Anaerolineales bacterium]
MQNNNLVEKESNIGKILKWSGTLLTLLLFFYLLQKQNWETISATIQLLSLKIIFIVWVLFIVRIIINSFRWQILLRIAEIQIPFFETLKLSSLGLFISNFLPSTIGGDGIRFLALTKFEKDKSLALSSIIIDRLVNVVAIISLLPVTLFVYYENSILTYNQKWIEASIIAGLSDKLKSWKNSGRNWIKKNKFWLQHPKAILSSVFVSWIGLLINFFGVWLIAKNLGMSIKYYQVMGISTFAYMVTLLPISINGYGLREVTITTLYTFLGYPMEAAISLAVITRLIYLSTSLIGALWLPENLSYLGKKIPKIN